MTKLIANDVYDAALAELATATNMTVCSSAPANYAGISAVTLASTTLTAGIGNGDYTKADGDTSGRKLTVAAQSGITVSATGTATHLALDDGTTLLAVTSVTSQSLTSGNTVNVPAFDVELADPT